MNRIKLQDLTPNVYYNQSRDFQFIGRLFDVVLNSSKLGSEQLYNNQLSNNSDEKLIDLMTLTLGFKSQHNYNIKQLTAMCSAFCYILKNKGNILSIKTAITTLLNAEGIIEPFSYELKENNTVLNIYLPQPLDNQSLVDINLLKDLFAYILPAGMSCNIIRAFTVSSAASTRIATTDGITPYLGVRTFGVAQASDLADLTSVVIRPSDIDIEKAQAKNTKGLIANSDIVRPN